MDLEKSQSQKFLIWRHQNGMSGMCPKGGQRKVVRILPKGGQNTPHIHYSYEVKSCAYEVKSCAYEVKSCAYEVKS